jgi:release factor glutamine methyltransferase
MTPCALLRETTRRFREAGIPDPETDGALLLSFLLGKPPLSLRLDTDSVLSPDMLDSFDTLVRRRLDREPLQYITGEAPFCGRMFFVDRRVLIPRPETEELCAWALENLPASDSCRVLDLCCGSGCIGLTLAAERPHWDVVLADCSPDALEVAALNASRLDLSVSFHQGDLTEGLADNSFDCIVSNPPYIPSAECAALQPEVLQEPSLALDGGTDGLDFYRRIADEAAKVLKPEGLLMLELGFGEAEPVSALLAAEGFTEIAVRNDFSGIPRMLSAHSPARRNYV